MTVPPIALLALAVCVLLAVGSKRVNAEQKRQRGLFHQYLRDNKRAAEHVQSARVVNWIGIVSLVVGLAFSWEGKSNVSALLVGLGVLLRIGGFLVVTKHELRALKHDEEAS